MPNWVRNTLEINAPSAELAQAFLKEMSQPRPEAVYENYEWTGEIATGGENFSFWNLTAPPADRLEEYFGRSGYVDGKQVGETEYNWYNWNIQNWGCKWDCQDVYVADNGNKLTVSFSTAWDVPRGIVVAMAKKYPDLQIEWRYLEEQCWGGVYTLYAGHAEETQSWDNPSCHAEFVAFGIEEECVCQWGMEEDVYFDDCPRVVTESLPKMEEPTA